MVRITQLHTLLLTAAVGLLYVSSATPGKNKQLV